MTLRGDRFEVEIGPAGADIALGRTEWPATLPSGARDGFRRVAAGADSKAGIVRGFGELWEELVLGRSMIEDHFRSADRWYVVFRSVSVACPLRSRDRALLECVLAAGSQKWAALEHDVSAASVSASIQRGLRSIGLDCKPQKVPLFVALLARDRSARGARSAHLSECVWGARQFCVLSFQRPELKLRCQLTPAQYEVTCGIVDGATHQEIAHQLRKSSRTVANQAASAFRRLRVSGRCELLDMLLADCADERSTYQDTLIETDTGAHPELTLIAS